MFSKASRMPTNKHRRGFTLIEIMIVVTIILVIAVIAIPRIDAQRMLANEVATVRMVQTIHTAQAQFYAQFGRYAAALAALGPPASGVPSEAAAALVPGSLASGKHSGYRITMTGGGNQYSISASPVEYLKSGRRSFFSDETGVLREHWGAEPADAGSQEAQSSR